MAKKERALIMGIEMLADEMKRNVEKDKGSVDFEAASMSPIEAYDVGFMKATEMWEQRLRHIVYTAKREFGGD